jgi:hypothetical protein
MTDKSGAMQQNHDTELQSSGIFVALNIINKPSSGGATPKNHLPPSQKNPSQKVKKYYF